MNRLRDADPDPRDSRSERADDEGDPTGVRALLAALPDPGPMPVDLVHRISASLAAEQALHEAAPPTRDDADHREGDATLHSLVHARRRRTVRGRGLSAIAVAASIVVLAGAVVLGVFAMNNGLGMRAGMDTAAESAVSDSGAEPSEEDGAMGGDESSGAAESAPQADGSEPGQALSAAGPAMFATGTLVTSATLAEHARAVRDGTIALAPDAAAERNLRSSTVGTQEGAAECLGGVLGISAQEASARVALVDVVRYDGVPAVLILAHGDPIGTEGSVDTEETTAYLVPMDCGPQRAVPLHDPVRIDS